jgi:biotin transport system substrate-specific component
MRLLRRAEEEIMIRHETHRMPWPTTWLLPACLATAGALSLALLSQVKIFLPGTPVPLTLQVMAVILLGGMLGPRLGVAALAEYIVLGACGLPVFANGLSGMAALTGPTAGYLFGFLLAAGLCGMLVSRCTASSYRRRFIGIALAGLAGLAVAYLCGWVWLTYWAHTTFAKAFVMGVTPYFVSDILKVSAASSVLAMRRKGAA